MFVILPFEKAFYAKYNVDVEYEGHPLLDAVDSFRQSTQNNLENPRPYIVLMPGSRKQEISAMLPIMIEAANKLGNDYDYLLAAAPTIDREYLESFIPKGKVKIVYNNTYGVLSGAIAGMVTSGTATLEAALFKVPQVVCYKTSPFSFYIARMLVSVKYISLANLILDRPLLKELIQNDLKTEVLVQEMKKVLPGGENVNTLKEGYQELDALLGGPGTSQRVAQKIYTELCEKV
jgi:lipid-A-disaccharide synthase